MKRLIFAAAGLLVFSACNREPPTSPEAAVPFAEPLGASFVEEPTVDVKWASVGVVPLINISREANIPVAVLGWEYSLEGATESVNFVDGVVLAEHVDPPKLVIKNAALDGDQAVDWVAFPAHNYLGDEWALEHKRDVILDPPGYEELIFHYALIDSEGRTLQPIGKTDACLVLTWNDPLDPDDENVILEPPCHEVRLAERGFGFGRGAGGGGRQGR